MKILKFWPNKRHLQKILFSVFYSKKSAAEEHRMIIKTYDKLNNMFRMVSTIPKMNILKWKIGRRKELPELVKKFEDAE